MGEMSTDLIGSFSQMMIMMVQLQMLQGFMQSMVQMMNPHANAFGSIGAMLGEILPILILVKVLDKLG